MSWFQDFVDEVVAAWPAHKKRMIKEGILSPLDKGRIGENFVERILVNKGYTGASSKGSRSPSDVWGIKGYEGLVHIALIQVKTAVTQKEPEEINDEDETELMELAKLTWDYFQEFEDKPEDLTNKSLIISVGYAGVVGRATQPRVYSARYINDLRSKDKFEKKEMNNWLRKFHKLQ